MEYIRKKIKYLSMISYNINNEITTPNVRNESYIQILTDLKADLEKIDKNNPELKLEELLINMNRDHNLLISYNSTENYKSIKDAHYDWWVFPIPDPSNKRLIYSVFLKDIKYLKRKYSYITEKIRKSAIIVCNAWGWDLLNKKPILSLKHNQNWNNHNIRLFKMILSLLCFGLIDEANSAIQFGKTIKDLDYMYGTEYNRRDYRYLFV